MNFTTEFEDSFLEPLLFAIRLFLLFLSRTNPLHQMLSISTANEVEMVQSGASFLLSVQQVHDRSKWHLKKHLKKQTYSTVNEAKHTNKEPPKADFCHGIYLDYHWTTVWVSLLDMQHAPELSKTVLSWLTVEKLTHFVSCLEWDGDSLQLVSCLLT